MFSHNRKTIIKRDEVISKLTGVWRYQCRIYGHNHILKCLVDGVSEVRENAIVFPLCTAMRVCVYILHRVQNVIHKRSSVAFPDDDATWRMKYDIYLWCIRIHTHINEYKKISRTAVYIPSVCVPEAFKNVYSIFYFFLHGRSTNERSYIAAVTLGQPRRIVSEVADDDDGLARVTRLLKRLRAAGQRPARMIVFFFLSFFFFFYPYNGSGIINK